MHLLPVSNIVTSTLVTSTHVTSTNQNLSITNENQENFEMQPMESHLQIDNVESMNTPTTMNPSNSSSQETIEMQPIKPLSRIINVKSINVSDVKIELAHAKNENINNENQGSIELQPIESISRRIDTQHKSSIDENVTDLHETSRMAGNQVSIVQSTNFLQFNNTRFNKNLINLTGLVLIIVIIIPIPYSLMYLIHTGYDVEVLYMMVYVLYCCLAVGLPSIYFIMNQKHLMIALNLLNIT